MAVVRDINLFFDLDDTLVKTVGKVKSNNNYIKFDTICGKTHVRLGFDQILNYLRTLDKSKVSINVFSAASHEYVHEVCKGLFDPGMLDSIYTEHNCDITPYSITKVLPRAYRGRHNIAIDDRCDVYLPEDITTLIRVAPFSSSVTLDYVKIYKDVIMPCFPDVDINPDTGRIDNITDSYVDLKELLAILIAKNDTLNIKRLLPRYKHYYFQEFINDILDVQGIPILKNELQYIDPEIIKLIGQDLFEVLVYQPLYVIPFNNNKCSTRYKQAAYERGTYDLRNCLCITNSKETDTIAERLELEITSII